LAVAWILQYVVRTYDTRALEGWSEYGSVARHWKLVEVCPRDAGERVERVAFAALIDNVVKEGSELRADEFGACVGNNLDDLIDIKLGGNGGASAVQHVEFARFGNNSLFGRALFRDVVALDKYSGRLPVVRYDGL